MKTLLFILTIVLTSVADAQTGAADDWWPEQFKEKRKLVMYQPYLQFKLPDGTSNESLKGKVVLINFWFSGCHPCLAEMKGLNRVYDSLRTHPDFVFLSLTFDPPQERERIRERFGISYPIHYADKAECKRLNLGSAYPTMLILDRGGNLVYWNFGGIIDEEQASTEVVNTLVPAVRKELELK